MEMPDPINEIERLIYMWRRYEGTRNAKYGKVWLAKDIDELESRIAQYLKTPSKFDWNKGVVPEKDEDEEPTLLTGSDGK